MAAKGRKTRKKYTWDLHDQPYDHETNVFNADKEDPDYDPRDLADPAHEYRTTEIPVKEQISHGEAMRGAAEQQTYNDESDTRPPSGAGVTGRLGVRNQNIAARKATTGSLIADAGGYSTEIDPALLWKSATVYYCQACGEPIGSPGDRIPCDIPSDPCSLSVVNGRLTNGCQACREQWAIDRKHARTRGNPPQTCRPLPGERKSKCARRWDQVKRTARRNGVEPVPAAPKLTKRDQARFDEDQFHRENAEWWLQNRPPVYREVPPYRGPDRGTNGTGFPVRPRPPNPPFS